MTSVRCSRRLVVVAVVLASVLAPVTVAADATPEAPVSDADTDAVGADVDFISVTTNVSTSELAPEEEFNVTVSLTSSPDSERRYRIRELAVLNASDPGEQLSSRSTLGVLEPNTTKRRNVGVTINETGRKDLLVEVRLLSISGEPRRLTYPLTVEVGDPHPQLDVDTDPAVGTSPRTMRVTVSNGLTDPVRQVSVDLAGEGFSLRKDRRVTATVPAGETASFEFTADPEVTGPAPLTATLSYRASDGDRRTVTRRLRADFSAPDEPTEHPQLSVDTESAVVGAWRPLNVTVANGLDESVRQVAVSVAAGGVDFEERRRVAATMDAGATRTFAFRARTDDPGTREMNVTLSYTTADGVRQRIERGLGVDFSPPDNPGRVRLTGVDVELTRSDVLEVTGSASNVGRDTVESVIVAVADERGVVPASPQPEFFVGTVEGSDFVSFDLTARVTGDRETVPVRVTYLVDGVERSLITEIPYQGPTEVDRDTDSSGPGSIGLLVPGVMLVVLALVGVTGYRRIRG